jgi:hypothetical protein
MDNLPLHILGRQRDSGSRRMSILTRLRNSLTGAGAVEDTLAREIRTLEERVSKRLCVLEERVTANEQAMLRLGQRLARVDGRTSVGCHPPDLRETGALKLSQAT